VLVLERKNYLDQACDIGCLFQVTNVGLYQTDDQRDSLRFFLLLLRLL
jgi:hypothetical protein